MEKIKKQFTVENILCAFIILCPILDITSFLYRNLCETNFSPATILRPIIPIVMAIYIFWKQEKKSKLYIIGTGLIYGVYALLHLYVMKGILTKSSYSTVIHEAQYLINYSFMILNLWIYSFVFRKGNKTNKLVKSILIASGIYIVSIYISILTKTSSSTYIEGMGYKGWFESGNSIGSILILSLFMIVPLIKDKEMRKFVIPIVILIGIFLTSLLGTRVGLLGFLIVIFVYGFIEVIMSFVRKGKINKKVMLGSAAGIVAILALVTVLGSTTIQRRKHLKEIEKDIIDTTNNQEAHITGSLLEMKEKIEKGTIEEGYLSKAQEQSILDLYRVANQLQVKNNDQRTQQLIYNLLLVKNQKNPIYLLVGNGYLTNYRELVLEMEIPAFLFNFGIIRIYFIFYSIFRNLDLWSLSSTS